MQHHSQRKEIVWQRTANSRISLPIPMWRLSIFVRLLSFTLEQTILASEAGKSLIIEKPIALSYEESKRMLEVVKKNNTRTSVCFEVRQPELESAAAIRRLQKDAP